MKFCNEIISTLSPVGSFVSNRVRPLENSVIALEFLEEIIDKRNFLNFISSNLDGFKYSLTTVSLGYYQEGENF